MLTFDTVVIGGGSAGAVLAARLSENRERSVLLIEAGPDYPDLERLPEELKFGFGTGTDITTRSHNWTFYARATDLNPRMLVPRGRVTGGTSAVNGQVFRRALPDDFAAWVAAGNDEWSFEAVRPYFRRIEQDLDFQNLDHGDRGPTPVMRIPREAWLPFHRAFWDACRAAGIAQDTDQNAPGGTGVGARPFNNFWGVRMSTALCYLGPARNRPNLTIWPHCIARRIGFSGTSARYVEVEGDSAPRRVAAGEIVLAAGTIGSAHLLLLSGVGPAAQLRAAGVPAVHDVPGVGQNLRDHPVVLIDHVAGTALGPSPTWAPRMPIDLRCTAPGSELRNDLQIIPRLVPAGARSINGTRLDNVCVRFHVALQLERSRGELRLLAREPAVQPLLDYGFLTEETDRKRLREAVRLCYGLTSTPGFDHFVGSAIGPTETELESDADLDRWVKRNVTTEHHVTSTCQMGSNPEAVVDQHGCVYGMEGLRVVDGSIMPDCIRANTNATIIMMAERVADWMR